MRLTGIAWGPKAQKRLLVALALSMTANVLFAACAGGLAYRRSVLRSPANTNAGERASLARRYAKSPARGGVVFLGDSLTYGLFMDSARRAAEGDLPEPWLSLFAGGRARNRAIGRDTTGHVLARVGSVTGRSPEAVFLMAGINDLAEGSAPTEVAAGVAAIVARLRAECPGAAVCVQSILPVDHSKYRGTDNESIQQANRLIRSECERLGGTYADLFPLFKGDDGLRPDFSDDGEHVYGDAYDLWRDALTPLLPKEAE